MPDFLVRLVDGIVPECAGALFALVAFGLVAVRGRARSSAPVLVLLAGLAVLGVSFGIAVAARIPESPPHELLDPEAPLFGLVTKGARVLLGLPLTILGALLLTVRRGPGGILAPGGRKVARRVDEMVRLESDLATRTKDLATARTVLEEHQSEATRLGGKLKETLALLLGAEERFRAVFERSQDGLVVIEIGSGRILKANPRLAELTGVPAEKLVRVRIEDVFGAGVAGEKGSRLRDAATRGQVPTVTLVGADRRRRELELGLILVEAGGDPQVLGIVRDVAERERLHDELEAKNRELEEREKHLREANTELSERAEKMRAMNERLRELQEVKDNFLSSVSHELRTPLTSIRSFSEILLQYKDAEDDVKSEFISIINKESERLTRLINDVLDLARIEAGEMKFDMAAVDLRDVSRDVVQSLSPLARERQIRIAEEFPSVLPAASGDRDKLQQVLTNLVSNALKVAPEGSTILIGAREAEDDMLEMAVRDEGPGIAKEDLLRIFDKFQQLQSGDTVVRRKEGTGLGLAICREIVTLHGGRIWAKSTVGRGSIFHFTVRRRAAPVAGAEAPAADLPATPAPVTPAPVATGPEGRPERVGPVDERPAPRPVRASGKLPPLERPSAPALASGEEEPVAAQARAPGALPPLPRAKRPAAAGEDRPRRTLPPLPG